MFDFAGAMLGLFAILSFCLAYVYLFQGESGQAPLAALAFTVVWLSGFACLNALSFGLVLYFVLAAIFLLKWTFTPAWRKRAWKSFFSPGMIYFLLASVGIIAYFALRQPVFQDWDEFSFWGMAPKLVKLTGQMYTAVPSGMRAVTFTPGLVALDSLFLFVGSGFVPWKVYAAYGVLFFAIGAAALSAFERKDWAKAVPVAVLLFLIPYMVTVYYRNIYVVTAYLSAYADLPLGLLFGGGMALYFCAQEKTKALLTAVFLCLVAEAFIKDMGFALALVAAAIISFDLLFLQSKKQVGNTPALPVRAGFAAAYFAGPVLAFMAWAWHLQRFLAMDRFAVGGAQNMGAFQMVRTGLLELLGIGRTEKFTRILNQMTGAFFRDRLTFFGSGALTVAVIFGILFLAFIASQKAQKIRVAAFSIFSALGFLAFYIFNGFTYIYVFKDFQVASGLVDYNRYIYPYYAGWLVAALALLAVGLHQREKVSVARLGALVLCALCLYRFQQFVPSQLSVIDYPDSFYQGERRTAAQVERYTRYLPKEARVFFISQHDNGLHWFRYFYYFYPYHMDYSFGGGTLSKDMIIGDGALEASFQGEQRKAFSGQPLTPQRLVEYIEHQKIDYLFIHEADETLRRDYGHLFADGLEQWSSRRTTLYRVERQNGRTIFVPVAMEGGAPQ